jgi:hypothetical protein
MYKIYKNAVDNCNDFQASPFFVNDFTDTRYGSFLCYYSDWSIVTDIENDKLKYVRFHLYQGRDEADAKNMYLMCQTKIEEMSKSEDANFEHYSKSLVPLSGGYERQIYVPLKPLASVKEPSWQLLFKNPSRVDSIYYVGLLFSNQNK